MNPLEVRALLSSFQRLGASTNATAVSADGSVVVGNASQGPMYWTQSNGVVYLHDSSGNIYPGGATSVSGNGSVIVGDGSPNIGNEPFRWANGIAAPIPQVGGTAGVPAARIRYRQTARSSLATNQYLAAGLPICSTGATLKIIPRPQVII